MEQVGCQSTKRIGLVGRGRREIVGLGSRILGHSYLISTSVYYYQSA